MSMQKDPDRKEIKFLNKFIDLDVAGRHVLEIGCGEGRLTWQYARMPGFTTGIDVDSDALRVATIDRPSDLENKVCFCNARSEQLPFKKETFDIAILAWSF